MPKEARGPAGLGKHPVASAVRAGLSQVGPESQAFLPALVRPLEVGCSGDGVASGSSPARADSWRLSALPTPRSWAISPSLEEELVAVVTCATFKTISLFFIVSLFLFSCWEGYLAHSALMVGSVQL